MPVHTIGIAIILWTSFLASINPYYWCNKQCQSQKQRFSPMLKGITPVTKINEMSNVIAVAFCGYFALLIILFSAKNFLVKDKASLNLPE
jgi:hypothetical protein